jgi:TRAP-type C4-dicarboxylate transport system permease small subunit
LVWLEKLARWCAVLGGILLIAIALVTCASVIGRNWLGMHVVGDFELTGALTGVAIASFFPWCQLTQGNIIVDFFTASTSAKTRAALDRWGALLVAMAMAFLAWRTTVGGINAWSNHSSSMLLGLPDWLIFLGMAPALALTAAIALGQTLMPEYTCAPDTPHAMPGDGFTV